MKKTFYVHITETVIEVVPVLAETKEGAIKQALNIYACRDRVLHENDFDRDIKGYIV